MGTSPCFFATIAKYPPNKMDQPHRHTSAAINYYFIGHGKSAVMGGRMEWEAGDLHLSAPGWAVHNHGSREQGFCALTIQDHPLQIAMESLMWQETMKAPIVKLGSQMGFQTNMSELEGGLTPWKPRSTPRKPGSAGSRAAPRGDARPLRRGRRPARRRRVEACPATSPTTACTR